MIRKLLTGFALALTLLLIPVYIIFIHEIIYDSSIRSLK